MAIYYVNQNRQFYVVENVQQEEPKDPKEWNLGDIYMGKTKDEKQIFFKHFGQGGLTRSDIIDVEKVCYAHLTKAEELERKLKKAVIKLDDTVNGGNPIVAQDYVVRIYINNYLAPGDDNVAIKHGAVHAYATMTPEVFYKKLAKSLAMNFSREVQPLLTFEVGGVEVTANTKEADIPDSTDGVVVKEVEQPWVLGTYSQDPVNFSVSFATVKWQGDDVVWGERNEDGYVDIEYTDEVVSDGKKIADLEYFCHGERGDQYRNIGWPNVIPTKYMVDPTKEYDVLDMHYFFSDTGVNVQKSEKDITFVAEKGGLEGLKSALEEVGITVQENEQQ